MEGKEQEPFISIILPVRNEAKYIERALFAVFNQDYPSDKIEVLVVDGMSTDQTREIVSRLQNSRSNLQLLDNPGLIVPVGLNIGLRNAKGEILVRVDGHCEIASDYINRCVYYLQMDRADVVGGPIETVGETYLAQAIAIGMSSKFGVGNSAFRTENTKAMFVDTVAFPAFTRRAIEQGGCFDEELVRNQDDEYSYRLRKLGMRILLAPEVRARYYSRSTLPSLWRQYFQYGFWKVRVLQKHPRQMSWRQFIPPLLVGSLLTSIVVTGLFTRGWVGLVTIIGAYTGANLFASLWTSFQRGWQYLPLLPIVFGLLHFAYGTGFLLGLLKFRNRWKDT